MGKIKFKIILIFEGDTQPTTFTVCVNTYNRFEYLQRIPLLVGYPKELVSKSIMEHDEIFS